MLLPSLSLFFIIIMFDSGVGLHVCAISASIRINVAGHFSILELLGKLVSCNEEESVY